MSEFTSHAQGDPGGPAEYDLLAALVGEYTYGFGEAGSPTITGRIVFESFGGGRFVKFDEEFTLGEGDPTGVLGIVGYDAIGGHFTWYRAFTNGAWDHGRGTLEDGTITFDMLESRWEPLGGILVSGPGIRVRTKWTDFSEDGMTVSWEQSVDGGPWEQLVQGDCSRLR